MISFFFLYYNEILAATKALLIQFSSFKFANIDLAIACKNYGILGKLGVHHLQP